MTVSTGEKRVYAEFFTNGAVAWLSAGVIAPLFGKLGLKGAIASLISVVSCIVFLRLASYFGGGEK